MATFTPGASRATNVAALKAAIMARVATQVDGAKAVAVNDLTKFLGDELVAAAAANPLLSSEYLRSQYLASSGAQSRFKTAADGFAAVVGRPNWEKRSEWPITSEADTAEQRVAKLDSYQGETWTLARDIILHFEGLLDGLPAFVRRWLDSNMLHLAELDEDGNVVPGSFPDAEDPREDEPFAYFATCVTDRGEESAPSPVSELVMHDARDVLAVALSGVPTGRNITTLRLYRSATTARTGSFRWHSDLPLAGLSIANDTKLTAELGDPCPTLTWEEPPADLTNLVGMPNGVLGGLANGNMEAVFCEPFHGYAWPPEYGIPLEYPGVGAAVFDQTMFVGTTGFPYLISGADSMSMAAIKLAQPQACISRRSLAAAEGGVFYVSPDGICFASHQGVQVVSAPAFNRDTWGALNPAATFGAFHEGVYYLAFEAGGVLCCDMASRRITRLDLTVSAFYVDHATDTLYAVSGTSVVGLFAGVGRRTGRYRTGRIILPAYSAFAWLHVESDFTAPATVRIYRDDGLLWHTRELVSLEPVRLPAGRYREWEIEVESAADVTRMVLASSTLELQQA